MDQVKAWKIAQDFVLQAIPMNKTSSILTYCQTFKGEPLVLNEFIALVVVHGNMHLTELTYVNVGVVTHS